MREKYRKKTIHFKCKGSLTVEAALIVPIFLSAVMTFLFFFQMIGFQMYFYQVISKTAQEIAQYGYIMQYLSEAADNKADQSGNTAEVSVTNESSTGSSTSGSSNGNNINNNSSREETESTLYQKLLEQFDIKELLTDAADSLIIQGLTYTNLEEKKVEHAGVVNGWNGISFWGSELKDEDGCVIITASYHMKIPFFPDILPSIPVTQRIKVRNFCGYQPVMLESEENTEDENYVYVAENGSVYHTSPNCTYLKLSTQQVDYNEIDVLRNQSGGKYYPCESCIASGTEYNVVIITDTGDRYHSSITCPAIKRTYSKVLYTEVEGMKECSRCKARDEKEKKEE